MDKNYLKSVERKLKKQGKSEIEIAKAIKKIVNPEEEERDLPEVTNPLQEDQGEIGD